MTVVTWNSSNYSVPATGEEDWGGSAKVDGLLLALATHGFQKTGGTFTLTADADFGATAGLKSLYYKGRTANPSTAGIIRLAVSDSIGWRNNANGGNLLLAINASDQLTFNGSIVIGMSPTLTINRALVSDGTGTIISATTTATEIGYVNGVSSAIQTQLNTDAANLTTHANLTAAHGATGSVMGTTNSQTVTNKTMTASENTLSGLDFGQTLRNYSLACTFAGNAMTIALKDASGSDCSATSKAFFGFRSSTAASGIYNVRTVSAALSTVISSGSTGGLVSSVNDYVYVYVIDNAGTPEIAWMGGAALVDEAALVTTTAEGGVGAADTRYTLYSTTARANVPARLIARLKFNMTAGTWTAVSEISLGTSFAVPINSSVVADTGNGHGVVSTKIRRFTNFVTVGTDVTGADSANPGTTFTINVDGLYYANYTDTYGASIGDFGISLNSSQLTTSIATITKADRIAHAQNHASGRYFQISATGRFKPGDVIRAHTDGNAADTSVLDVFRIVRIG